MLYRCYRLSVFVAQFVFVATLASVKLGVSLPSQAHPGAPPSPLPSPSETPKSPTSALTPASNEMKLATRIIPADVNTDRNGQATWLLPAVRSDFGIGNHGISAQLIAIDFYNGCKVDWRVNIVPEQ